jgi:hypothetical protein
LSVVIGNSAQTSAIKLTHQLFIICCPIFLLYFSLILNQ